MKKLTAASILALAVAWPTTAQQSPPFDTPAPIAYLEDLSSGAVLYAKDADRRIPPASMAKMMTVYVAFDLIKKGELKLSDTAPVRPETWKKWHSQGSTMFLAVGENPRVEDLLNGIVTLSGNDACVVLAEKIAGTEESFVNLMNQRAKELGLSNSQFGTSNGWPDEGRTFVTARDLAHLAKATIEHHPELYKQFYSRTNFTWGKTLGAGADITQGNRDPLLGRVQGADGLKTGHTEEAGYGFTGSAQQNGRRLVMVIAGLDSYGGRAEESVRFMEWGFRSWKPLPIASKGKRIGEVEVQGGGAGSVGVVAPRDLNATVPAGTSPRMTGKLVYLGPVKAPIKAGQHVADLIVETPGMPTQTLPLVAEADVGEAGFFRRVWLGLTSLFG
ncbi:D-alanyl-D-alanine carboxypeptidase (penicillin-binding protein 5/6) [Sphingomonas naasensis]|uniref:serine-type D-Ala-D-Ala carboxypeptidase n=1 Tax=Sphingomonas naasensis TaxID=1344951 RepID=A0A4S1WQI0_9SPHN|nr:D-alanyl-D-alanine carboxypeptidase family protein [Sphingomonas naasensis]NIJ18336.1 D-alanyl-D-alanine carboxypeptidase (penicillin-binding protein 5/6) [Sphingomonas naasensis]TGX45608.1 D-alanyl-D-alanine carboxypeptidase [Sphingomonas naasensis]